MKRLNPSSAKILLKTPQNRVRVLKNISWNTVPLWWGTGTPFLFPKAWIPSCADLHGIIHSTSLPLRGGGTICDRPSQPKLPYLKFGDSLWMEKGEASIPSHRECSAHGMPVQGHLKRALPSSGMLYTNHWDCSQPLPPFASNIFR